MWNYYRDEINASAIEFNNDGNKINNNNKISKSLKYKAKIIGRTRADNNTLDPEVVVQLKYLSNFWRFLDFSLNNCEIEVDLSSSNECIISEISITPEVRVDNPMPVI